MQVYEPWLSAYALRTLFNMLYLQTSAYALCLLGCNVNSACFGQSVSSDKTLNLPTCIKVASVGVFVCVEVLGLSQPIRVMSSMVSLPNHIFSWTGLVL